MLGRCRQYGDPRLLEVTEERNGPSGLRDDDDDDDEDTMHIVIDPIIITRKLSYRKDDRAMRPIYGCPEKFPES